MLRKEPKLPQAEAITGNPRGRSPENNSKGSIEMNRDFLKGLGLEAEQVDAVMGRYGTAIATKETDITNLKNEKETLETKIKDLEDGGDSDLKDTISTLETEKQGLEKQLANQAKQHKLEVYVNSLGTKDPAYIMAKLDDVELEDDEFVGIDERVKELQEAHPLLFEADEPQEPEQPPKPKPWAQGNSTITEPENVKPAVTDLNAHRIIDK